MAFLKGFLCERKRMANYRVLFDHLAFIFLYLPISHIHVSVRSTQAAPQGEFCACWRMLHLQRTVVYAIAISRFISSGYPMTRVAVVRVAVAEPERD